MGIAEHLLSQTVTWQQPGETTDEYNNILPDWEDPDDSEIAAYIEQVSTTEIVDGRDSTVTRMRLFTNELGIHATDRIVWGDDVYEVDGDCAVFHTPAGPHHLEATLRIVDRAAAQTGS